MVTPRRPAKSAERIEPRYLTPAQAADRLGVSMRTVQAMLADGRLPATLTDRSTNTPAVIRTGGFRWGQ